MAAPVPPLVAFSRQFSIGGGATSSPPEVCLGWTLPPAAAIASAQSFDGVMDVAERFQKIREQNQRGTMLARQNQKHNQKQKHGSLSASDPFTFVTCLLNVTHPMSRLMSSEDVRRLQTKFIETERSKVVQCAHSVALEYYTHVLKKAGGVPKSAGWIGPTVDAVRDSIVRDPTRAFTDDGLNHAVVYHLTQHMEVAVVVRPGPPGSACFTFVPKGKPVGKDAATLPCVLIARESDASQYRIEHEGPRMSDVWAHLRSQPEVKASFAFAFAEARDRMDKLTIPEIHPLAAMVGMAFGGGQEPRATASAFGGKGGLIEAIMAVRG
jgi:hypothetical protein